MITQNNRRFSILVFLKKAFAISCLTALLLSASSISYFYWVEEKLHEQAVFTKIEDSESDKLESHDENHTIRLFINDKNNLPEGYNWEEEGREFSYNGMFYDIISLKKSSKGWELIAVSDEEEAAIVANKNTPIKNGTRYKLSRIQLIFITSDNQKHDFVVLPISKKYGIHKTCLYNRSLIKFTPPPEAI
jgi:hypothetical protein